EPATVKIVQKKFARFLENPMEWLDKMIAEGTPQEIYVSSQILEGDDRDRGAEKLIRLLEKSTTTIGRVTASNILTALTGQTLGTDAKRWQNWLQTRTTDKEKKKK